MKDTKKLINQIASGDTTGAAETLQGVLNKKLAAAKDAKRVDVAARVFPKAESKDD